MSYGSCFTWTTVLVTMLAACGGEGSSPSDDGGGGTHSDGSGAGGSGGAGSGAGGSGAGGSGASGGGGPDGTGGGTEYDLSGPLPTYDPDFVVSVSAYSFGPPSLLVWRRYKDAALGGSPCSTVVDGSCALFTCGSAGFEGEPDPGGFGEDYLDAGTIRVSYQQGATTFTNEVTTNDSTPVFGGPFDPSQGTLMAGDLLTFSLSGDDIPALSAMVPFPKLLNTTTAGEAEGGTSVIRVDRTQDFTLTWEGGAPGVIYQVTGGLETGPALLYCEFDSTVGEGVLPASLLSQVSSLTRLATVTASARRETVAGYEVSFATGAETLNAAGTLRATLELF